VSHGHDEQSNAIRALVAHPSLVDGRDASGHALYRSVNGRLVGKLPQACCNPSAAGNHDSDFGGHPPDKPEVD
jgi:hypothetical protein